MHAQEEIQREMEEEEDQVRCKQMAKQSAHDTHQHAPQEHKALYETPIAATSHGRDLINHRNPPKPIRYQLPTPTA
jgi:hypothetical protein